jgi:hypothetical protein
MIAPPAEVGVEEVVANLVLWLKLVIEAIGAPVIGAGMIFANLRSHGDRSRSPRAISPTRDSCWHDS